MQYKPRNCKNLNNTQLSLELKQATLVTIFNQMAKLTQFEFTYGDYIAQSNVTYDVSYKNKNIASILDNLSSKANFQYKIEGNYVLIGKNGSFKSTTPQQHLKGKVTG